MKPGQTKRFRVSVRNIGDLGGRKLRICLGGGNRLLRSSGCQKLKKLAGPREATLVPGHVAAGRTHQEPGAPSPESGPFPSGTRPVSEWQESRWAIAGCIPEHRFLRTLLASGPGASGVSEKKSAAACMTRAAAVGSLRLLRGPYSSIGWLNGPENSTLIPSGS